MISGCVSSDVAIYADKNPRLDVREYFDGPISAWGFVQDWRGRVIERFDIQMVASWNGNQGVLDETFTYYGGNSGTRVWQLTRLDDGSFTGTAGDVHGTAQGTMAGNAINMKYQLDVPRGDGTIRLTMDDWMWLMNDGVVINKTKMKKFGLTVGNVTVFMQKAAP